MKICRCCKEDLPLDRFGKNLRNKDGKNSICLLCDKKVHQERRKMYIRKLLMRRYAGMCVACGSKENLELKPLIERKRNHANNFVLLCGRCIANGAVVMNKFLRDCTRCGYRWVSRKEVTVTCPNCGSPYWFRLHLPKD